MTKIEKGDGWAVGSLDALGDGPGFRKVRRELGVTEFGVNALVMPPGVGANWHWHERQQEVYFVHSGTLEIHLGEEDEVRTLGPGGVIRVDAGTRRSVRNGGDDDLVLFVVGAEGGYVGRDGVAPEDEPRVIQSR